MKVALFTGNYNHIADGVSLTLNRLVSHLELRGHTVLVFGPHSDRPAIKHTGAYVPVPSIPMPVGNRQEYRVPVRMGTDAARRLKAFKPDIVHLATPDMLGKAAIRYAKQANTPIVASYHTNFCSYLSFYGLGWLEPMIWRHLRGFYKSCLQLYVPSQSMADVLHANGILADMRIWEHGVEADRFNPTKRSLEWRRNLGFADEDRVVAFVSRLVTEKGLDVFREVVQRLSADGVAHKTLFVGAGPMEPGLRAALPDAVFTGHLKGEALARAFASAEVFLFPSDTETFGLVTLEAMASGLPAVCADATGSKELVEPGVTGFLAPPKDVDAFYKATRTILEDATLRQNMSQEAVKRAQLYDWETIMRKIECFYEEAINEFA
ncbi:MAG: glycosyltransferase family 1 protein [Bacteroidetes Order II. Incertae sedis bacterium]|nr:glycosyltransferase family 1 protein [Bacteroidetes Order II. bacterium]